jgi:hypothetical protein
MSMTTTELLMSASSPETDPLTYFGFGETRRIKNRLAISIAARACLAVVSDLQRDWIASVAGDVVSPSVSASTSP